MPRSFRAAYAAARSEACAARHIRYDLSVVNVRTLCSQMSQPATSPYAGLADRLHPNYSTGFVNVQPPASLGEDVAMGILHRPQRPTSNSWLYDTAHLLMPARMIATRCRHPLQGHAGIPVNGWRRTKASVLRLLRSTHCRGCRHELYLFAAGRDSGGALGRGVELI
jgi:hypothetical protein